MINVSTILTLLLFDHLHMHQSLSTLPVILSFMHFFVAQTSVTRFLSSFQKVNKFKTSAIFFSGFHNPNTLKLKKYLISKFLAPMFQNISIGNFQTLPEVLVS